MCKKRIIVDSNDEEMIIAIGPMDLTEREEDIIEGDIEDVALLLGFKRDRDGIPTFPPEEDE